jgi:hypothetical protein
MNDALNKKLAEIMSKMDEKVLKARLNAAMDMLKKGDTEELAKKLNKMDKADLLEKINDLDDSKLKDLKIDKNEIKQQVSSSDLDKLSQLLGDHGDEIINKIKDIIK